MEHTYSNKKNEVSILKVFIKSRTVNPEDNSFGYSIDIQCQEIFLTEDLKKEVEKISALTLSFVPEIQAYRYIKDVEHIIELRASQFMSGNYKVIVLNTFERYLKDTTDYDISVSIISKKIIEKIVFIFNAYSLQSY